MARVYYKEEKIQGNPVKTQIINLENFETLMRFDKIIIINESDRAKKSFDFLSFLGGVPKCFNYFSIRNEGGENNGLEYKTTEGYFFLPKSLIFYDTFDFDAPSVFYFIALIGNELEIRYVNHGGNLKWFNIPDLHKEVTDASIIRRMEATIKYALNYIAEYKEPEKEKVQGIKLNKKLITKLLDILGAEQKYTDEILDMAESPSDYFDSNQKQLSQYQIFDASPNMYLLYLVSVLEENKIMAMVDWKEEYSEILSVLNKLSGFKFENIDGNKYKRSTSGKILSALSQQVETKTNKTIFCIDTDSDDYSFGLIEKDKLQELIKAGKDLKIKIYQPKK
jgi:hypothetical protein